MEEKKKSISHIRKWVISHVRKWKSKKNIRKQWISAISGDNCTCFDYHLLQPCTNINKAYLHIASILGCCAYEVINNLSMATINMLFFPPLLEIQYHKNTTIHTNFSQCDVYFKLLLCSSAIYPSYLLWLSIVDLSTFYFHCIYTVSTFFFLYIWNINYLSFIHSLCYYEDL